MSVLSTVVLIREVARVDGRVDVQFRRVRLVPRSRGVTGTFDSERKDDRIPIRHRVVLGRFYSSDANRREKSDNLSIPTLASPPPPPSNRPSPGSTPLTRIQP